MKYSSIVIGAGLSGLCCALLLARSGRKVLVVEQHRSPGPVVSGFKRGGICFDSGFHYAGGLGEGGPLLPLLRHLGLMQKIQIFPYDPKGFDLLRVASSGREFALPVGFENIKEYLVGQFPQAAQQIELFLGELAENWRNFPYLNLDVDWTDFGLESVHGCSLRERLEAFSAWPELQGLLSMHSLLYGVSPDTTPLNLNAQVAGSYFHSVHGIAGGGRRLIDALLELLVEAGVEVRCKADVSQILTESGSVSGVRLKSGEELLATEVIATLNPSQLPDLLPAGVLRPAYQKRLKALRQTPSAYILFARSQEPLEFLRGRNFFVQHQAGIFSTEVDLPLEERSFYLAGADQGDSGAIHGLIGIVPADYSEVSGWSQSGRTRPSEYQSWKQQISGRLLQMFYRNCPQLPQLELLELATPLTLADYSRATDGAIYGVGRCLGQYNPHPATRLPGLFLAGQAVTAPGLMGSMVSSYLACGSILGHEKLRGELRECR